MCYMKQAADVDGYIKNAPDKIRDMLSELRNAITSAAPEALEKISYGMPYYGYHGRLAYFRYTKTHIGLYIPPPVLQQYKKELSGYSTSVSTIRFPLNKTLPIPLIIKLIKARMKINTVDKR